MEEEKKQKRSKEETKEGKKSKRRKEWKGRKERRVNGRDDGTIERKEGEKEMTEGRTETLGPMTDSVSITGCSSGATRSSLQNV